MYLQKEKVDAARAVIGKSLGAKAGDVSGGSGGGGGGGGGADSTSYFVYLPPDRVTSFTAFDLVELWTTQGPDTARKVVNDFSSEGCWNPMTGPGFPGLYADRSAFGLADVPSERVLEFASWEGAAGTWEAAEAEAWENRSKPYVIFFVTPIDPQAVSASVLLRAVQFVFTKTCALSRVFTQNACSPISVGIHGSCAWFALTIDGKKAEMNVDNVMRAPTAKWSLAVDNQTLAFSRAMVRERDDPASWARWRATQPPIGPAAGAAGVGEKVETSIGVHSVVFRSW